MSDDMAHPELCELCEEAGCDPDCSPEDCDCQRSGAYEPGEDDGYDSNYEDCP